ncbi:type II toxin-antitoxin system HicB family antitoxin [Candidatus Saccharibacteria bacterium]|nr:type II toxin-antitoxin system HicB family antitoxin [Candidatus Saccharibacteria bacterium]
MKYNLAYKLVNIAKSCGLVFDAKNNPEIKEMQKTIAKLENKAIIFRVAKDTNGDWYAESTNLPGILTGGNSTDDINEMIKDAIFTYFGVPAKYCDDRLLRHENERVEIKREAFVAV